MVEFTVVRVRELKPVVPLAFPVEKSLGTGTAEGLTRATRPLRRTLTRRCATCGDDAGKLQLWNCDAETPVLLKEIDRPEFAQHDITVNDTMINAGPTAFQEVECAKLGFKVLKTVMIDGIETVIESDLKTATKYNG